MSIHSIHIPFSAALAALLTLLRRKVHTIWIPFLLIFLFPQQTLAQGIAVLVLGVPGYDLLLMDLSAAGYLARRYGPSGRPAGDFQVVSIGTAVPPAQALEVLRKAKERIPSLKYVVLTGDRDPAIGEAKDIYIGGSNRIMDQFPDADPLTDREFQALIRRGEKRTDLFYTTLRRTYLPIKNRQSCGREEGASIRDDGVIVVPKPDGSAELFDSNGRRGERTTEGREMWFRSNLAPLRPAQYGGTLDQAWLDNMNKWLESIALGMSRDLEILLPNEQSLNNYRAYEGRNAKNLYDQIQLRRQYLSIVIDSRFLREE